MKNNFTGRGGYEVDLEAMQAGATLYLTKDEANPLLLERVIRYAIEIKQKETSLRISEEKFARSFRDAAGKITGGIVAWRDISERKKGGEEE